MESIELADEAGTFLLGERIGRLVSPGDVVLLSGDLGAGKTTLVQGLAAGLGIAEPVVSPTFALVCEYSGRAPLRHLDLYRLEGPDLALLGAEEWFDPDAVVAVEWPDRLGAFCPPVALSIALAASGDGRMARVTAMGDRPAQLVRALMAEGPCAHG